MTSSLEREKEEQEDPAYLNFVNNCRSLSTRRTYENGLLEFMAFTNIQRYSDICKMQPKELEQKIIAFVVARNNTRKAATVRMNVSAIKHFCSMNDITQQINFARISKYVKSDDGPNTHRARPYTREEIQKILEECGEERQRVVVLLLVSTGMRIGAVADIKIADIEKITSYNNKEGERVEIPAIYKIVVYPKTKQEYVALSTPEAAKRIDRYLEFRKRKGEHLTPNSPLIRENFDDKDAHRPQNITTFCLRKVLERSMFNGGIRTKGDNKFERKQVMIYHGLRKWWEHQVLDAGVNALIEQTLIGHRGNQLLNSYYRPTLDKLVS